MRAPIAISVVAHALLWAPFAFPGSKPLPPSPSNPIEVEIVTPREAAEASKPQQPPTADHPDASNIRDAQSSSVQAARQREQARQSAQAPSPAVEPARPAGEHRLAETDPEPAAEPVGPQVWGNWLDSPLMTASIGFDSVGNAAKLSDREIAALKARLQRCWNPPPGLAEASHLVVVLRVSLAPTGAIVGEPNLVAASATPNGAALMQTALRALQNCQPFGFLPAAKYQEWRNLDLSFSPSGLSALPKL